MSNLYDPKDKGFSAQMSAVDRCQVVMLRDLAALAAEGRLILKGGMAMRASVGGMRLTKDVDFDRGASLSTDAAKSSLKKAMLAGAQSAGLRSALVDVLKATDTTLRLRLSGEIPEGVVKFVVELSGRSALPAAYQQQIRISCPPRYGIAPFNINVYTHNMLAASKVLAVMSPNRNVPRDIYDLHDLLAMNPTDILAARVDIAELKEIAETAVDKLSLIDYDQAVSELLPYIAPAERASITSDAWDHMTLTVAEQMQRWAQAAVEQ